jgi:hypothetical protein
LSLTLIGAAEQSNAYDSNEIASGEPSSEEGDEGLGNRGFVSCTQALGAEPGECVQRDGMRELVSRIEYADAFILASARSPGATSSSGLPRRVPIRSSRRALRDE